MKATLLFQIAVPVSLAVGSLAGSDRSAARGKHKRIVQHAAARRSGAPITVALQPRGASTDGLDGKKKLRYAVQRAQVKYQQSFTNFLANNGFPNPLQNMSFVPEMISSFIPTSLMNGLVPRQSGSESLTDVQHETLWVGAQAFGTPPQFFKGGQDFDTGSSDTWVNPHLYDPKKSSTAKDTGETFTVSYGDGTSANGKIYDDTVTIAGLKAYGQAVGAATTSDIGDASAGIAGMAFPSIAQFDRDPFFYTLMKQKAVGRGVFGFGLWTNNARLDLGSLDAGSYTGQMNYVDVDSSNGFWQTSAGTLNGVKMSAAIIDTGTTVVVGPPHTVAEICLAAGGVVIPEGADIFCGYTKGAKHPPTFTFAFNGQEYTLSREATDFTSAGPLTLTSIIGSSIGLTDGWILGDVFMRELYIAFDVDATRVGFAQRS